MGLQARWDTPMLRELAAMYQCRSASKVEMSLGYSQKEVRLFRDGEWDRLHFMLFKCFNDYIVRRWMLLWPYLGIGKVAHPDGIPYEVKDALDEWREDVNLEAWYRKYGWTKKTGDWLTEGGMPEDEQLWLLSTAQQEYMPHVWRKDLPFLEA